MAIAGKVAITPKGEWSADKTYEKLDLVFYDNASYVATKPSTGVLPTDESYWMLVVQSAGGADLDGIIDGTIQVGNAKTLDGHEVDVFAKAADLSNYFPKSGGTLTGNLDLRGGRLAISSTEAVAIRNYLGNANRNLMFFVAEGGDFAVYDNGNSKFIMQSTPQCVNIFNGTASGNIKYTDKPTGTYTGNGDATERTINIGGIGEYVAIRKQSSKGVVIVSRGGYFGTDGNSFITGTDVVIDASGNLIVATTNAVFNENGKTYEYAKL